MTTVIMRTTGRIVVPIVLIVAMELFLQGHQLPGGGFIGGILTVGAFALVFVAYGLDYLEIGVLGRDVDPTIDIAERRTVRTYRRLFAVGLALTVGTGFGALLFGEPFLAQTFTHLHLPLFGDVELATALIFDVGIFCVVVGGLLTIFSVVGAE